MYACITETPQFFNDICDEIRLFENVKRIEQEVGKEDENSKVLRHFFRVEDDKRVSACELYEHGILRGKMVNEAVFPNDMDALTEKKLAKRLVKQNVYELYRELSGKRPPWGSLTGIRPTKLLRELQTEYGVYGAGAFFREEFDVSEDKTHLAECIVHNQRPFLDNMDEHAVDIYVGIPFCASRCKYCSFVSREVERGKALKDSYLQCLYREMQSMQDTLAQYTVRAVYIGGGTPTALDAAELDSLLENVTGIFGTGGEFTVEAGRPDTVTKEKLEIIKQYGAQRISINAQTANDDTLKKIGRRHSVQEFLDAFELARAVGFETVNTDIILGLPDEGLPDVKHTLDTIAGLEPENITVHTLAIKNSSEFALEQSGHFTGGEGISECLEYAHTYLAGAGYLPYYLYRQKYMNGNMENTGYAKHGHICAYNIDNMEETVSVMAFGAGGISKKLFNNGSRIERAANVKDVEHYVNRVEEMAGRKMQLF